MVHEPVSASACRRWRPGTNRPALLDVTKEDESLMGLVLAIFILALLFGGLGFAVHALWIVAVVLLALWVLGFLVRGAEASWYRW